MTLTDFSVRSLMRCVITAVLVLVAAPVQAVPNATQPASYRLGIFPYMAPRQTVEFFGPMAQSMEAALQHPVRLESVPTFADFRNAMAANSYDIALIQPFDYPELVEKQGYVPLAQMAVPLVTQIYVRDDSTIQKIEDLRGTVVAMPPAEAANARMTLRALYDHKLIPGRDVEVRYFNSHDSCIQQVWVGAAAACGTAKPPIQVFEQRMQAKLRSIYDTPPVPHIVFVAHPRVPAAHRAALAERIIGWSQTDNGRALLKNLGFPGFIAARPGEYGVMRNYDPVAAAVKAAPAAGKDLVLGVFPYLAIRQLLENFSPAVKALEHATGKTLQMQTATSYSNFQEAVAAEKHDIVFVQPFDYKLASGKGYLPLAAMQDGIEGVYAVLDGSPYAGISDLKGKVVAMPPEDSALSRIGRRVLAEAGLRPGNDIRITYTKNQEACMQVLQQGGAAACMVSLRTLTVLPKDLTRNVRAISKPQVVPGALFMAHKRLDQKLRQRLQAEILGWKDSDAGRAVQKSMQLGDFVPVIVADYAKLPRFD